jgi:hypothetical protein
VHSEGVLEITDELGQVVYSEILAPSGSVILKTVNLGSQSSGIYFARFTSNSVTAVQKVIIQR